MKKLLSCILWTLFALMLLLPVGMYVTGNFGYVFHLRGAAVFVTLIGALSAAAAALSFTHKELHGNILFCVLSILLAPLSLLHAVCYVLAFRQLYIVIHVCLTIAACVCLVVRHVRLTVPKTIVLSVSGTLLIPIELICLVALTFGNFGHNTVIQTLDSPNGTYRAQVIDNDQGALGGATLVEVQDTRKFDALLFTVEKESVRVYTDSWRAYETMQIQWQDDDTLLINGMDYPIVGYP